MKQQKLNFLPSLAALFPWLVMLFAVASVAFKAEAAPPPNPFGRVVQASEAKTNPYVYDTYMMSQVEYWADIGDQIDQKLKSRSDDPASFTDSLKFWLFVLDNNIVFNAEQSQYICLNLKEADDQPCKPNDPSFNCTAFFQGVDVAPNWPASGWPQCGGVLDTMFGQGAAQFLNDNRDDDKVVKMYSFYLSAMNFYPQEVEKTINKAVGDGDVELIAREQYGRVCSTSGDGIAKVNPQECRVMCIVTKVIMGLLESAAAAIVAATAGNATFQSIIVASLILYVTIYGVSVTMGIINVGIGDAVMRVVKMSIVAMLISSETVHTLFHMFRCFFLEGTTYLVNVVMLAGIESAAELGLTNGAFELVEPVYNPGNGADICGNSLASDSGGPLTVFDSMIAQVFSGHMWKVLLAVLFSGLHGVVMFFFMVMAVLFLIWTLVLAVTTYLMALVAQYLLLSLMPFFIAFILFESTKDLFRGWLNQLLAASLVPIFLFAFVSLFIVMLLAGMASILDTAICKRVWIDWVMFEIKYWSFADTSAGPDNVRWLRNPPFGYFDILIVAILAFLLKEFVRTVELLAKDFADSIADFSGLGKALRGWFTNTAKGVGKGGMMAAGVAGKGALGAARGTAHAGRFAGRVAGDAVRNTNTYQKVAGKVSDAKSAVRNRASAASSAVRDRIPEPVANTYRKAKAAGRATKSGVNKVRGVTRTARNYVSSTWKSTGR